jgi:pyruvate/2-oxoglutarate/acetoin dehydrogenase E1 component
VGDTAALCGKQVLEEFEERIMDTPLSEAGFVGQELALQ